MVNDDDSNVECTAEMEPSEFLAMLFGKDLQEWTRTIRYRWKKISKVRSVVACIAENIVSAPISAHVFGAGVTPALIMEHWHLQVPKKHGGGGCSFDMQPLGQSLLDGGLDETKLFEASRATEMFFENRVAACDRLSAWFVLFHAMVKPSSKLPFLPYEIGASESRLRVASTPAPVPSRGTVAGPASVERERTDVSSYGDGGWYPKWEEEEGGDQEIVVDIATKDSKDDSGAVENVCVDDLAV